MGTHGSRRGWWGCWRASRCPSSSTWGRGSWWRTPASRPSGERTGSSRINFLRSSLHPRCTYNAAFRNYSEPLPIYLVALHITHPPSLAKIWFCQYYNLYDLPNHYSFTIIFSRISYIIQWSNRVFIYWVPCEINVFFIYFIFYNFEGQIDNNSLVLYLTFFYLRITNDHKFT